VYWGAIDIKSIVSNAPSLTNRSVLRTLLESRSTHQGDHRPHGYHRTKLGAEGADATDAAGTGVDQEGPVEVPNDVAPGRPNGLLFWNGVIREVWGEADGCTVTVGAGVTGTTCTGGTTVPPPAAAYICTASARPYP